MGKHVAASTDQQTVSASTTSPRRSKRTLFSTVAVLLGVALLLYPVVSTLWNNWAAQRVAEKYSQQVTDTDQVKLDNEISRAVAYNKQKAAVTINDPWNNPLVTDDAGYEEYLSQLSLYNVMARLRIPAIGVDLPVLHGTSDYALSQGVGHLYGTDLPVGGDGTHAVLTGHTGIPKATLFDNLKDLKVGQSFYIDVYGQTLRYKVYKVQVVLPDQVDSLRVEKDRDLMTLITCTPYGVNSHRLLVHAERAPYDPADEEAPGWHLPGQLWMWGFGLLALLALILLILSTKSSKNRSLPRSGPDANEVKQ